VEESLVRSSNFVESRKGKTGEKLPGERQEKAKWEVVSKYRIEGGGGSLEFKKEN